MSCLWWRPSRDSNHTPYATRRSSEIGWLSKPSAGNNSGLVAAAVQSRLSDAYPAVADTVPVARAAVCELAAGAGLSDRRLQSLQLAVSEAVTNVVRHAYPDRSGTVWLTAALHTDELCVLVADSGCGHQTRSDDPGLGLGLALIAHECDQMMVSERAGGGTELRMRFLLAGNHRTH